MLISIAAVHTTLACQCCFSPISFLLAFSCEQPINGSKELLEEKVKRWSSDSREKIWDSCSKCIWGEFLEGIDSLLMALAKGRLAVSLIAPSMYVVGYSCQWETGYTWLVTERNEAVAVIGMSYRLYMRHNCRNKYSHFAVWNETPSVCICKASECKHS